MKRIVFAAMIVLAGLGAEAKSTPQTEMILSTFHNSFRYAKNVTLAEIRGMYRIEFTEEGQKHFAYYNEVGEMIVTAEIRQKTDLPVVLQTQLEKKYSASMIEEIYEIDSEHKSDYYVVIRENGKRKILQAGSRKWHAFTSGSSL